MHAIMGSPAAVVATLLGIAAWSHLFGPFDGEWRLERQVRQDLAAWEEAGQPVDALPAAQASRATEITGVAGEAGSSRLTVSFVGGACATYAGRSVESEHAVAVLVLARSDGQVCKDIGLRAAVEVQLDDPVGQRVVYDAASGRSLTLTGQLSEGLQVLEPGERITRPH